MWNLEEHEQQVFARNPLESVVFQLRFHPILKMLDRVADFQEAVRQQFPIFEEARAQQVDLDLRLRPEVYLKTEKMFIFRSEDTATRVALTANSVSITELNHISRVELKDKIKLVLDSLTALFKPVIPTRFGLRYINLVDCEEISRTMNSKFEWSDLVKAEYLNFPLTQLDNSTRFYTEITSPKGQGAMTVRYGILADPEQSPRFRLDVDRFQDKPGSLEAVIQLLDESFKDIYAVFRSAANESLLKWMATPQ